MRSGAACVSNWFEKIDFITPGKRSAYQMSLAETCICREDVEVLVITPAEPDGGAAADVYVIRFGVLKFAWLKTLKASARNWSEARSVREVSFLSDTSSWVEPGPIRTFLPRFP